MKIKTTSALAGFWILIRMASLYYLFLVVLGPFSPIGVKVLTLLLLSGFLIPAGTFVLIWLGDEGSTHFLRLGRMGLVLDAGLSLVMLLLWLISLIIGLDPFEGILIHEVVLVLLIASPVLDTLFLFMTRKRKHKEGPDPIGPLASSTQNPVQYYEVEEKKE